MAGADGGARANRQPLEPGRYDGAIRQAHDVSVAGEIGEVLKGSAVLGRQHGQVVQRWAAPTASNSTTARAGRFTRSEFMPRDLPTGSPATIRSAPTPRPRI